MFYLFSINNQIPRVDSLKIQDILKIKYHPGYKVPMFFDEFLVLRNKKTMSGC